VRKRLSKLTYRSWGLGVSLAALIKAGMSIANFLVTVVDDSFIVMTSACERAF